MNGERQPSSTDFTTVDSVIPSIPVFTTEPFLDSPSLVLQDRF